MTIPSNTLPDMQIDTSLTSPKGSAAAQRALDYYLKPAVSEVASEERFFDVNRNISSEEALVHASDLLRCAVATAHESANQLQGASRDLAFSTVHMIDMAKAMVERALEGNQNN
ncbi:hypothetical protein ACVK1X_000175 [Pseudomonas sp. PvR086]|jgi:hypothetical protein|uniref:DUF6124 family protein n=1 Tax=Pseudomonas TaxID=286 RepID=UPI00036276F3|nr:MULTISPECIES: DUF3077 domain-containing protein [Pseudomonas]ANI61291.1 hypothetical protein PGR6_37180 [Pseudomonas sp. GR 6-02]MBD9607744.1 DUF3077 domain-containing protein [Pseudomonas sp. PDM08]MBD9616539.1 DUF3077 domain-containing protein [Pseudomonas sp. PDM07]MDR7105844.1 hypothetical protein [Pseudomonas frederiksbergensis]PMY49141.1 DUF3077 domain-containing protein [Pseudomonas sp. FW305-53]